MQINIPGLILAGGFALLSVLLASFGSFIGAATIALLAGIALGNSKINLSRQQMGLNFTEKTILEAAIVLIGFGMNATVFSAMDVNTWLFIGSSVIMVIMVAFLVGRWFGLSSKMGVLLGAGSAICGSAAIGAISPLLRSKEEETGLSIGIINLLSTLGLLLLPVLSSILVLTDANSGLMIGGIIQSMGHVVGAGYALGDEVGTTATVAKMGRVLLIIPLMAAILIIGRSKSEKGSRVSFPIFIPLFSLALILAQLPFFPQSWALILAQTGDYLLVVAMVAIGVKIKIKPLIKLAGPALGAGFVVFGFQIVLYLLFIYTRF